MTVNRLDGNRVLIILADSDMSELSLDYNAMSLGDSHSRRVLLRIMRLACRRSGIITQGRRVNIEAMMMSEGCYLLVTVGSRRGTFRLKEHGSLCCRLESADELLCAAEALYRGGIYCGKNAAYKKDGAYYLIFDYPCAPAEIKKILSEFAEPPKGGLAAAWVREHGMPLCEKRAIEVIGKAAV